MEEELREAVSRAITGAGGVSFSGTQARSVSGGCIHESAVLEGEDGSRYFVKVNDRTRLLMFETEFRSLEALGRVGVIRVPRPVVWGEQGTWAFLVLEALDLRKLGDHERMGRELAALHRHTAPGGAFGWPEDNFLGATRQENGWRASWVEFFVEKRLGPQFGWAREKGHRFRGEGKLLERVGGWIGGHEVVPSLLHGDLWGGNAAFDESGRPVLFDPACSFGDRETDLAFTRMFGGFPAAFYEAYEEVWPLPPGAKERVELYNLYHLLNHFLLFGGSYGESAQRVIDQWV